MKIKCLLIIIICWINKILYYYLDKEIFIKKYMIKRILCNKMLKRVFILVFIIYFLFVDVREELNICVIDD